MRSRGKMRREHFYGAFAGFVIGGLVGLKLVSFMLMGEFAETKPKLEAYQVFQMLRDDSEVSWEGFTVHEEFLLANSIALERRVSAVQGKVVPTENYIKKLEKLFGKQNVEYDNDNRIIRCKYARGGEVGIIADKEDSTRIRVRVERY